MRGPQAALDYHTGPRWPCAHLKGGEGGWRGYTNKLAINYASACPQLDRITMGADLQTCEKLRSKFFRASIDLVGNPHINTSVLTRRFHMRKVDTGLEDELGGGSSVGTPSSSPLGIVKDKSLPTLAVVAIALVIIAGLVYFTS